MSIEYSKFKEKYGTSYANEKNKDYAYRLKRDSKIFFGDKCQSCGYDKTPNSLHFHHVIESTKLFNISEFYSQKGKNGKVPKSISLLVQELNKCILVCANCHNEIHAGIKEIDEIIRITITEADLRIRNKKTHLTLNCDECGKQFDRWQGASRHETSFCSIACTGIYWGKKKKGISVKPSLNPRPTKIQWPTVEELEKQLETKSYTQLGKELGVSDNAIRKHIKMIKSSTLQTEKTLEIQN